MGDYSQRVVTHSCLAPYGNYRTSNLRPSELTTPKALTLSVRSHWV